MSVYRLPGARPPELPLAPAPKKRTSFEIRLEAGLEMQRRERLRRLLSPVSLARAAFGILLVGLASVAGPFAIVVLALGALLFLADIAHYR